MGTLSNPPPYMQEGSAGPAVNLVIAFLNTWAKSLSLGVPPLPENGQYVGEPIELMKRCQTALGIDADGRFGPLTRQTVKEREGFDFVTAAQELSELSEFVQQDGTIYYWAPGIDVTVDRHEAEHALAETKTTH